MWFFYYTAFSLVVEERWDGNFSQSHGLFHRCHPEITMRICGGQINFAIWAIDPDSCCGQLFSNRRQTFGVTSQTVAVHHQHPVIDSMSCITDQRMLCRFASKPLSYWSISAEIEKPSWPARLRSAVSCWFMARQLLSVDAPSTRQYTGVLPDTQAAGAELRRQTWTRQELDREVKVPACPHMKTSLHS